MVFTHPYKGTIVWGWGRAGRGKAKARAGGGWLFLSPEAVAGVAQTLLPLQANIFAQQYSVAWGESFIFNTVAWKLLQLQIFSPTYLLGNPEIIPKGYIRREKRSHVRFLQSQT